MQVIEFAKVVPDRGFGRDHVGLITAVSNYAMRALGEAKVFAVEVPAGVHQLDCIERAAAIPRRDRGVGGLAVEKILYGNRPLHVPLPVL